LHEPAATHAVPQRSLPLAHSHSPETHSSRLPHAASQAPQWAESSLVSTQLSPHAVRPSGQAHSPAVHVCSVPHAVSQAPQCSAFESVSTQLLPQSVSVSAQSSEHADTEQTWSAAHTVSHAPQ